MLFRLFATLIFLFLQSCGGSDDSNSTIDTFDFTIPVFESPMGITSDPSIIRINNDTLHMYYTAENFSVGLAISRDNGNSWEHPTGDSSVDFVVFSGRPDAWDQVIETVDVLFIEDEIRMYYTGYREDESDNSVVTNFEVGLAISSDGGYTFNRHLSSVDSPILPISRSDDTAMDRHAITSPNVLEVNGVFYMSYTGWNVSDNFESPDAGFFTLGAMSNDGILWNKLGYEILSIDVVTWAGEDSTINESDLLYLPDGTWYIFFTAEEGIGYAKSNSFGGPYQASNAPVVVQEYPWHSAELVAPDVLVQPGINSTESVFRIWYVGSPNTSFFPSSIGYSENAIEQ